MLGAAGSSLSESDIQDAVLNNCGWERDGRYSEVFGAKQFIYRRKRVGISVMIKIHDALREHYLETKDNPMSWLFA